jgi:hypothetical protein
LAPHITEEIWEFFSDKPLTDHQFFLSK